MTIIRSQSSEAEPAAGKAPGDTDGFWIFGYGSLMWKPGFAFTEARHAVLTGYRRCFCIYSMHHRGTPQRPGLVLGLDRGGTCEGLAYRIAGAHAAETLHYLKKREQISGVYREMLLPVRLKGEAERREVLALAYVAERAHPGYAGSLPLAVQARLLRAARGISGTGLDYLFNTLAHLRELGLHEAALERLAVMAGPIVAREKGAARARAEALRRAALATPCGRRPPLLRSGERKRFMYRNWLGNAAMR